MRVGAVTSLHSAFSLPPCLGSGLCQHPKKVPTSLTLRYPLTGFCKDTDNGAENQYGFTCSAYDDTPDMCGYYDDSDFNSTNMCCICGGGSSIPTDTGAQSTYVLVLCMCVEIKVRYVGKNHEVLLAYVHTSKSQYVSPVQKLGKERGGSVARTTNAPIDLIRMTNIAPIIPLAYKTRMGCHVGLGRYRR